MNNSRSNRGNRGNSRGNNGGAGGRAAGGRGGTAGRLPGARGRVQLPLPLRRVIDTNAALTALAAAAATTTTTTTTTAPSSTRDDDDPLQEEETFEQQNRSDYPGPVDSEDEDSDDEFARHTSERLLYEDDNLAVLDDDFLDSSTAMPSLRPPRRLEGCPDGWSPPVAPDDWEAPAVDVANGEVDYGDVDNPGNWSEFTYRAKFKKVKGKPKEYLYHAMPTGATPVPINPETGCRTIGDWDFHYDGWYRDYQSEEDNEYHVLHGMPMFRSGATRGNMFPNSRKGILSKDVLTHLGCSAEVMKDKDGFPDSLFFYQLLLPICDTSKNDNDPRMSFYLDVSRFSNAYANCELGLGTGYGHNFKAVLIPELVRWDGVIVEDGVRGGSNGAIFRRFKKSKFNVAFDHLISKAFCPTRWLEVKRVYKLCNNVAAPKKGQAGYDPAYKYDFIYKVLCHNVNAISKRCDLDMCGDETSWGHQGFGESGTGIVGQILGKPGISKGGQTVIISDVHRLRPRAYVHRHKCHEYAFGQKGPSEVKMIYEQLELLMKPVETETAAWRRPIILHHKPHMTWDNFFSGDDITQYAAEKGFGLTMTCRRDRLPDNKNILGKFWHKEKTDSKARPKAARYEKPIFAMKKVGNSLIQHTSFQSTSSCNITSVNALNEISLYVRAKERGRGKAKRQWGIEMNEARELYLHTYGVIDRLDHLIQNCCMSYR
jgi:hypothetical protein